MFQQKEKINVCFIIYSVLKVTETFINGSEYNRFISSKNRFSLL